MTASRPNRAGGPYCWAPKTTREVLCVQQHCAPDGRTRDAIQVLINVLDEHRPLGPDCAHGDLHTETCGCEA